MIFNLMMLSTPACIPSNTLVNCSNLGADAKAHRDTVHWFNNVDLIGKCRMEAIDSCTSITAEFAVE